MFDLRNNGRSDPSSLSHLILFDTCVSKNTFRREDCDYIQIFTDSYSQKFKCRNFNVLTTPMSFLELLGGFKKKLLPLLGHRLKGSLSKPSIFFDVNCLSIENKIRRLITKKLIQKIYFEELRYPKNQRAVKLFLRNGKSTYTKSRECLDSFYRNLAISIFLSNSNLHKLIVVNRESNVNELRSFFLYISKFYPDQSLANLIFPIYCQYGENKSEIRREINLSYIRNNPLEELLDFEAIHFLVHGHYGVKRNPIPVIFVTDERSREKWIERISFYKGFLKNLGLDVQNEILMYFLGTATSEARSWVRIV